MAIKLADVLERQNTVYPVLEAQNQSILGFHNGGGVADTHPLYVYYASEVE